MTISTIRTATQEDQIRLEQSAQRFCERHNIDTTFTNSAVDAIDTHFGYDDDKYLKNLWKHCASRALKVSAKGAMPIIAHGYIGVQA